MIYGNKIGGGSADDKIYVIESGEVEVLGVVVDDDAPELTATSKDVLIGQWFVGKNGLEQGTNDSPCCRVTSGIHEVLPGVEFVLRIEKNRQWDYTTLNGVITNKSTPYKVENFITERAVYDSDGNKIADITKDPNNCCVRFNIKNETAETQLLHFFICKEEYHV